MEVELVLKKTTEAEGFHQKCWISQGVFTTLNMCVGSFVEIQTLDVSCICSLWPTELGETKSISWNSTVSFSKSTCNINAKDSFQGLPNSNAELIDNFKQNLCLDVPQEPQVNKQLKSNEKFKEAIVTLKVEKATKLFVDVIMNKLENVSAVKKCDSSLMVIHQHCKDLLFRWCVKENFVVNCEASKLARLYGISHFVIKQVRNDNTKLDGKCGFIVNKRTDIIVNSVHSKEWFEQLDSSKKNVKRPGGLDNVINMLLELITLPLEQKENFRKLGAKPPRGVLLYGPPGCGKTSLVRYITAVNRIFLISINGSEAFGPRPGETEGNLRQVFQKAKMISEEGPCVLFIDELDSLCPRRVKSGGIQEVRATAQFLSLMDGLCDDEDILIIGATNRPSALDPALRRPGRLDREVIISPPTILQRLEILRAKVKELPVKNDLDLDKLAEVTNGYVGADLASLCHEAAYLAMSESSASKITQVSQQHFMSAIKKIRPSLQKGAEGVVDLRPVHWSDIGGLEDVKLKIKQAVEWPLKHPDAFARLGLKPPSGVLLYGPPGCCKTTLVRAAATSCHSTFLSISGAQLYSPYVGDSERLISEVFQKARLCAPSILFLDEIDSIIGKRSESGSRGVQERILSTLLNEMDGIGVRLGDGEVTLQRNKQIEGETHGDRIVEHGDKKEVSNQSVLVVAATNRPDLLDEALMRPGRMDRIIYVPHPDIQARKDILSLYTNKMKMVDCDLDILASKTDMYTGADLEALCREAALLALTENITTSVVTMDHFLKSLTSVLPSLNAESLQNYSQLLTSH